MKLDLTAVEEHAKHVAAQRNRFVSWRINVSPSGLVTLIFEDDHGQPLDVAGADTFAILRQAPRHMTVEALLA